MNKTLVEIQTDQQEENASRLKQNEQDKSETPIASTCCPPTEQVSCCPPSEKATCCGTPSSTGCGCK